MQPVGGLGSIHACVGDLGKLPNFSVPQFFKMAENQYAPHRVGRKCLVSVSDFKS